MEGSVRGGGERKKRVCVFVKESEGVCVKEREGVFRRPLNHCCVDMKERPV